jgi:hypothetical protein
MLLNLQRSLRGIVRSVRSARTARSRRACLPRLPALEDRVVPSSEQQADSSNFRSGRA